jgi:hypothetical protein
VGLPEIIGGKYRPRSVIGSGASGTVYSVEHMFTGELLALKVMRSHLGGSAEAIARFKREARAVSQIKSEHVVRIFDADVAPELDGVPYLVMDLLEGRDLEQIAGDRPVVAETVVDWLRQVASPLDRAHRVGIVHRDLKPENLFLTRREDGSPLIKILDFGIAKIAAESTGTTQWGQLFGTPLYMAPEQARGDPTQIGPATDLCAVGLIAFRLLAGVPYRNGTSLAAILNEILHEPLRAPSELVHSLGTEFDEWFLRACHADPARRFGSAVEQIDVLGRAFGLAPAADGTSPPSSVRPVDGANRDSGQVQPDSSGNAFISLRAAPVPLNAERARGERTMPGPIATEVPKRAYPAEGIRRMGLVAAGALIALPIFYFVLARTVQPRGGPTARTTACPIDSSSAPIAAVATATSPAPPAPGIEGAGGPGAIAMQGALEVSSAPPAPAEREPVRVAPTRPAVARAFVPRAKASADDDPLSDQQ